MTVRIPVFQNSLQAFNIFIWVNCRHVSILIQHGKTAYISLSGTEAIVTLLTERVPEIASVGILKSWIVVAVVSINGKSESSHVFTHIEALDVFVHHIWLGVLFYVFSYYRISLLSLFWKLFWLESALSKLSFFACPVVLSSNLFWKVFWESVFLNNFSDS